MKGKVYRRVLGVVVVFLLVAMMLSGLSGCGKDPQNTISASGASIDADVILLSREEKMTAATHILDAKYLGVQTVDGTTEYMFEPTTVIKGTLDGDEQHLIYVLPSPETTEENGQGFGMLFKEGETYLLCLEKNISVYYRHNKYVSIDIPLTAQDDDWDASHAQAVNIAEGTKASAIPFFGTPFTTSKTLNEVVEFSSNIFVVSVDRVYAESRTQPTTVYRCSVLQTIRNTPAENGNILITLFNDSVKIGGKYLVLLADSAQTAPVYTLSSATLSVFPVEKAQQMKELAVLFDEAVDDVPAATTHASEVVE